MAGNKKLNYKDIENNKWMAIMAYILPPVAYYSKAKKKSKWLSFHARQGMNLFLVELLFSLISIILLDKITVLRDCTNYLYGITYYCGEETPMYLKICVLLVGVLLVVIAVNGIVNVLCKEKEKLPIIGKLNLFK